MVDIKVTGSDSVTSDKPKFSLKSVFELVVFLHITEVIRERHPGSISVIQGNNSRPHQDGYFNNWKNSECHRRGWHRETQASQMTYVNNLDLAVSPYISKSHSDLLKKYSNNCLNLYTIYSWCK